MSGTIDGRIPATRSQLTEISNAAVALHREHFGRGPGAATGITTQRTLEHGVELVNAEGIVIGSDRYTLKLAFYDNKYVPAEAVTVVEKLLADGVRFLPVAMERDCEACHSLVYDKVGATFRTLRHGDIAQLQADLVAADRSPRRPLVGGLRRPGEYAPGGLYHGNFAGGSAAVARAMSPSGV